MSKYSEAVNKFLIGSLRPELDSLNIRLASMEEFGHSSDELVALREKANSLTPAYDFLSEYVSGEEECSIEILRNIIESTGLGVLSDTTAQAIVDTPITTGTKEPNYQDLAYLSVFVDGELYDGSSVNKAIEHTIKFDSAIDIDSIQITDSSGTITTTKSSYTVVNKLFQASGKYPYTVVMYRDGKTVYAKTIILEIT